MAHAPAAAIIRWKWSKDERSSLVSDALDSVYPLVTLSIETLLFVVFWFDILVSLCGSGCFCSLFAICAPLPCFPPSPHSHSCTNNNPSFPAKCVPSYRPIQPASMTDTPRLHGCIVRCVPCVLWTLSSLIHGPHTHDCQLQLFCLTLSDLKDYQSTHTHALASGRDEVSLF